MCAVELKCVLSFPAYNGSGGGPISKTSIRLPSGHPENGFQEAGTTTRSRVYDLGTRPPAPTKPQQVSMVRQRQSLGVLCDPLCSSCP